MSEYTVKCVTLKETIFITLQSFPCDFVFHPDSAVNDCIACFAYRIKLESIFIDVFKVYILMLRI